MIVRILGMIDLIASFGFLMLIFGLDVFTPFLLFTSGLLFVKGLFILGGDVLSLVDLVSALFLILSIFLALPAFLLWSVAFLLLGKGVVSFL